MPIPRTIYLTEKDMDRLSQMVDSLRQSSYDQHNVDMLKQELNRATVLPEEAMPVNVVTMNSRVRVRDLKTDKEVLYQVVFPRHADTARNMISVLAPIGTALLGYQVGSEVEWLTPGGTRYLRIEAMEYQPEAAGVEA
jgi:regulator of nucleoside diphosphate kinase